MSRNIILSTYWSNSSLYRWKRERKRQLDLTNYNIDENCNKVAAKSPKIDNSLTVETPKIDQIAFNKTSKIGVNLVENTPKIDGSRSNKTSKIDDSQVEKNLKINKRHVLVNNPNVGQTLVSFKKSKLEDSSSSQSSAKSVSPKSSSVSPKSSSQTFQEKVVRYAQVQRLNQHFDIIGNCY